MNQELNNFKSSTVGTLIKLLEKYPSHMDISNEQNEYFCCLMGKEDSIVLSTKEPAQFKADTVGGLIEALKYYTDQLAITDEQGKSFCYMVRNEDHLILSTQKPIAICNRTGCYVYPTPVPGYYGFCPTLDEDLDEFETSPIESENNIENEATFGI